MAAWAPLRVHSDFSTLHGLSKPAQIAKRCAELGYGSCAITDHNSVGGVPDFLDACEKAGVKGIAGEEFSVVADPSDHGKASPAPTSLCVLAKGLAGWRSLVKASSLSNDPANYFRKPRLSLEQLAGCAGGNLIVFSGHSGSDLGDAPFADPRAAWECATYDEARKHVHPDWAERVGSLMGRYRDLFGRENFYVGVQLTDPGRLPSEDVAARILRHCAARLGVPCVAAPGSYYPAREDAPDQRLLLSTAMDAPLSQVRRRLEAEEDRTLAGFFRSNNYHIPDPGEVGGLYTEAELAAAAEIASRCEAFSVKRPAMLPQFDCPGGMSADAYLTQLCREGWARLVKKKVPDEAEYVARVKEELGVLTGAGLSPYFLIVRDFINHAVAELGAKTGKGRGSAAGCLVSYLLGITRVDPVAYGLIFSRFYNHGRNSPGNISFPDIDTDFPVRVREKVIDYCRRKYGQDRVCQMVTFSRMQGRGAMRDVLRAHERCSFEEASRVTEHIPDEAAIADELQAMEEAGEDRSIIRWALENVPKCLEEWCVLRDDGTLDGQYAVDFAQAIRLEGTKRGQGRHPSGLLISAGRLADEVPMVWDKGSEQLIVGVDMRAAEKMGQVKFDILGTAVLDKLQDMESIVRTGRAA